MGVIRRKRKKCLRSLNAAIKEVGEAIRFLKRAETDPAESEIGDSLVDISRTLRCLNFKVKRSRLSKPKRRIILRRRCR